MIITASEREYLLESMKELLEKYDYIYSESALEDIIDTWAVEKVILIYAFKNHPNYLDGKFMIAFDANYDRKITKRESIKFSEWLRWTAMPERIGKFPDEIQREVMGGEILPQSLFAFFYNLECYAEKTLSEYTACFLNTVVPSLKVRAGQKTSRAINKLCCYLGFDKVDGYNREFAKYADSLNPLSIKRHTVLSINPLDYLTMSFGNSWASCHTIDKSNKRGMPNSYSGCYSSGTISYMLDPSSMVLYTVDTSYEGNEYWDQPKINRQMFHWGEEKLVQGRLYPQDNDGDDSSYAPYRNIVQDIMSTIFGFPNLWTLKKGTSEASKYIESYGTNYPDYYHFENCSISRIKGSENENRFTVGVRPICIDCGDRHSNNENISCCGRYICEDCGCRVDDNEVIWIDGYAYCRDCVSYCEHCCEYHRGDSTWIESERIYVCEHCLDNCYTYCDCCEEYVRNRRIVWVEAEEENVCYDCLDEHYSVCDVCGARVNNRHINYENSMYICDDCLEEREEDEEAC